MFTAVTMLTKQLHATCSTVQHVQANSFIHMGILLAFGFVANIVDSLVVIVLTQLNMLTDKGTSYYLFC